MKANLCRGPVLITKGPYKGRIGYYDDVDFDEKLIIYPNLPFLCSDYLKLENQLQLLSFQACV